MGIILACVLLQGALESKTMRLGEKDAKGA